MLPDLERATPGITVSRDVLMTSDHVPQPTWAATYAAGLVVLDALMVTIAAMTAVLVRFGGEEAALRGTRYVVIAACLAPVWVVTMALGRAYESRYLGIGSEEFKRVFNSAIRLTAAVATVAYAAQIELARGFVAVALPLGTTLTVVARYAARRALHRLRSRGACLHRVLVVGDHADAAELVATVQREPHAGFAVVAACLLDAEPVDELTGPTGAIPVLGGVDVVPLAVRAVGADTVAVTASPLLRGATLRQLSWELEGSGVALVVAPALTDVAGPRISIRPVAGLPLLHVEEPELTGGRRVLKAVYERVLAAAALLLLAPFLVVVGLVVRMSSPGPALFRQIRVGQHGGEFRLLKFRTMHFNAEDEQHLHGHLNAHEDGPLFKIRDDPRVTPVGRWLRRYSIDELPQLLNVLTGSMSLVGPRPPLPSEVATYALSAERRLLVKPGLTGLWQVSGRADLSWDETVRLDLYYVENWSPALDFMILWKTAFEVLRGRGAY